MASRVREFYTPDPESELHVCKADGDWILFNLARRIVQIPSKTSRQVFISNLRLVESPEYMVDLEREVRRQWPLRRERINVAYDRRCEAQ